MSHREQIDFFKKVYNRFANSFNYCDVIEIGSLNINGTLRDIFNRSHIYIGVDLQAGSGVDVISKGHEVTFQNESFDVALSSECFEHDEDWVKTFKKMIDLTKSKGFIIFSCATTDRPEHGTRRTDVGSSPFTLDYYKNLTEADFKEFFRFDEIFEEYEFSVEPNHHDLYFYGIKR